MSDEETLPSELQSAEEELEEANDGAAIERAEPFLDADRPAVRRRALRITGLAHFHRGDYDAAVPFLREVAEAEETTDAWFNVVTSATMAGQVSKGLQAFRRATELNDSEGLTLPKMHYYFARALIDTGEYERALQPLEWLREAYADLGITDNHFVHRRGFPFLDHTLELVVEVFRELARDAEGRAWLDVLAPEVDEQGNETIDKYKQKLS